MVHSYLKKQQSTFGNWEMKPCWYLRLWRKCQQERWSPLLERRRAQQRMRGGEREEKGSWRVKYPRFSSVLFLSRICKVSSYFINININNKSLFTYTDDDERTMVPVREANIMSQNLSTEHVAPPAFMFNLTRTALATLTFNIQHIISTGPLQLFIIQK